MTGSGSESMTGYVGLEFPEYERPPPDPMPLVRDWIEAATWRGVREPRALALATADQRGRASSRTVVITSTDHRGLVFVSHSCSQKGREIAATGWASGLLYWRETGQQLILSGPVEQLPGPECDALWSARPAPLHAVAAVTRQSSLLDDVSALRDQARRLEAAGIPLQRPESFVGYRLVAAVVEFWCASLDRLHRRLRYDRDGAAWRMSRLQP